MNNLRIKELLDENNLSPNELALMLHVSDTSIVNNWLKDLNFPNIENANKMANIFKCSIDYLLGRSDDYREISPKEIKQFGKQLNYVMKEKHITQYKLAIKDKIVSFSTLSLWLNKNATPSLETVIKLADYFGVSVDFLLGRE